MVVLAEVDCDSPHELVHHFTQVDQEAFSAVTVFHGTRSVIVHNDAHAPARQKSDVTHELAHGLLLQEAMHGSAQADVERLTAAIADELDAVWSVTPEIATLSRSSPRFDF
jgi:IrrE N-terminal-like domain